MTETVTHDANSLTKDLVADKVVPWLLLIVVGPAVIIVLGIVANIQPFQRGDLYVYDVGLLLAGAAEVIAAPAIAGPGAARRGMQGAQAVSLLLALVLAAQWALASTGKEGHIGGQWWVSVASTAGTGIVAFISVYVSAIGSAQAEVKRWTPLPLYLSFSVS